MDEEKRRRIAERFAMDDRPCGPAEKSLYETSEDAGRALGRIRQTAGLRGARERLGDISGRR